MSNLWLHGEVCITVTTTLIREKWSDKTLNSWEEFCDSCSVLQYVFLFWIVQNLSCKMFFK